MKDWIAGAIKHPGALHRQLGVPTDDKIPAAKIDKAAKRGGRIGKMAVLAKTLSRMRKRKSGVRNDK